MFQPWLLHNSAPQWGEGSRGQGESSAVRDKGGSDLKWRLSRAGEVITGIYTGSPSERVQVLDLAGPPQPTPQPMLSARTSPSLSSTAPLWGQVASAGSRESTHLKEMEPVQTQSLELLLQQFGTQSCPQQGCDGH